MSEAKRLRAEVQRKLKAVQNKINRTRKNTGANVSGSEFDPRRRSGIENRYNAKQLGSYLNQLNDFMRRNNQFVSGSGGSPLPRGKFNIYKKNEDELRARREMHDRLMGDIQTPTGLSIRQNQAMVPETAGSANYGPYRKYERQSTDIPNEKALEKLNKNMINMLKSDYLESEIEKGRENLLEALVLMGEEEFANDIHDLSDYQFDALWFGTNFAEAAFMKYHAEQERAGGTKKEKWQDTRIDSAFDDLGSLLSWARKDLPRNAPA